MAITNKLLSSAGFPFYYKFRLQYKDEQSFFLMSSLEDESTDWAYVLKLLNTYAMLFKKLLFQRNFNKT